MSKRRKVQPRTPPPSRRARLERRALERRLLAQRPRNLWERCQIWRLTRPSRLPEIEAMERRCLGALKGWETRRRRAAEQGGGAPS